MSTVSVSITKFNRLRNQAVKAGEMPEDLPDGWTKSIIDPAAVLKVFDSLRLKQGFVLRAYVFHSGMGGNGFVWAMPVDADFPEPERCPKLENVFLSPPKPTTALDDFMDAIEGDGTPWSYLSASLLARELAEFGADWHGCDWGSYHLLGGDPFARKHPLGNTPTAEWTWLESKPKNWKPTILTGDNIITVTFYTFCGLESETITRHVDKYKPGNYTPEMKFDSVATGGAGYIH